MEVQSVYSTSIEKNRFSVKCLILRQIILIMNPYNRKVYFCKDMMDYQENFELAIS